ncbi:hypothetical protein Nos7524_3227 [Nostoc sp. PCC 7524]|uniref:hypothetical protein n=1 Tax=Nostoc sp. (strain ATCC 29411 / PCC 7524) TaxID=28072 RepID=UPI00029F468A|nr:hypothetical protein [Nostoc sp. PCC 7524]AFY49027.1 hypothetical protein Nos7524_3227 [Nostoc sp. PCC 7524]
MSNTNTGVNENQLETPNKQTFISASPTTQDRIIDQVILQAGGVGLGIILSLIGLILLAKWLGLREAFQEWVHKQKIEAETLKSISDTLNRLNTEYESHRTQSNENTSRIIKSIENVDHKVTVLNEEFKDFRQEVRYSQNLSLNKTYNKNSS